MKTVLIIDDSWLTRRGVKRIVESRGYEVLEAENGAQALDKLSSEEKSVDALILDLLMPEMSGTELLEKLRESSIGIPVIVLTADIQNTVKERCINLGAKGFINKPPDPEQLMALVDSLF